MPKYEIKPGLALTTIPGYGVVKPGDIIEGDLDRFVPGKLRRVRDVPVPVPVKAAPVPEPVPEPESESDPEEREDEGSVEDYGDDEETPSMSWKKAELVAYAEELGLDTDGTKAEILARIEEYMG